MSRDASDATLKRFLDYLQSNARIRLGLGVIVVAALLVATGRLAYNLLPRTYALSITGGDILSNRHFLARVLQLEGKKAGIVLTVKPMHNTVGAFEGVADGTLDLAFVQGGLDTVYPNVEHVATVLPELVHLLVKPGIKGMADLRGRSLNLGSKPSTGRDIFLSLTRFAGYTENVDYVETNFTDEQLIALPEHRMPDAILTISSVPSYLVEILVKKHQYQVVEIPFPESLALRHGWAANGEILAYTYSLNPPVPDKNIVTVAVNMHLIANPRVDPQAISKLLEVLYSPSVANTMRQAIDEKRITIPSGYPLSAGLTTYLARNDSILTLDNWNKLTSTFGLVMGFSGMALVVVKWFRGAEPVPVRHDDEFRGYIASVVGFEKEMAAMETKEAMEGPERERARAIRDDLHALRITILERYPNANLADATLFDRAVTNARSAHEHARQLAGKAAS